VGAKASSRTDDDHRFCCSRNDRGGGFTCNESPGRTVSTVDYGEAVFQLVRLGAVPTADAAKVLDMLRRTLPPPRKVTVAAAGARREDEPSTWGGRERIRYAIERQAASGCHAELPARRLRPTSRRHGIERIPSPRKRRKALRGLR
jgi:hypothetical protein